MTHAAAEHSAPSWRTMLGALGRRKTAVMCAFGFASGLPYVLVIGTLNAWLGAVGVKAATIGVLSWVGLAYAFKFLWSPAVDRLDAPLIGKWLGRRRGWIVLCQGVIATALAALAAISPGQLGLFAVAAVCAAFASATQDVAIDAWRIEAADEENPLDLLSVLYQFGYRAAALVGGAGALLLSQAAPWPIIYWIMAALMACAVLATLQAPEPAPTERALAPSEALTAPGAVARRFRNFALFAVLAGWAWAIWTIGAFMVQALAAAPAAPNKPDAGKFMSDMGPWIVTATIVFPALTAAVLVWAREAQRGVLAQEGPRPRGAQAALDHVYSAIIAPLAELIGRLRWAAILALALILSYRLTDSIWGPFAYPFYLDELKYTAGEVAFASKIFGVAMTIAGIALAGVSVLRLGRMCTLTIGAAIAALSNLLYTDLALGGHKLDAFLHVTHLHDLIALFAIDDRIGRLLLAISGENIAGGYASAAFVVYLSSVVSRNYPAVQYALLSSLTLLIGSLGRASLGAAIDKIGYAPVFNFTVALGAIGFVACLLEWGRVLWLAPGPSAGQEEGGESPPRRPSRNAL
jgi:PAT family beta-lactamase induction signal transducer AmpG